MADAPMGDNGGWEAELARRVGDAEVRITAQVQARFDREWDARMAAGAAVAMPAAPRPAALTARPEKYKGAAQSLSDWLFRVKMYLATSGYDLDTADAVLAARPSWRIKPSGGGERNDRDPSWDAFSAAIRALSAHGRWQEGSTSAEGTAPDGRHPGIHAGVSAFDAQHARDESNGPDSSMGSSANSGRKWTGATQRRCCTP